MVVTKSKAEYTPDDTNFTPGKNSHLSALDPGFASLKPTIDPLIESVWEPSLSLEDFRKLWLNDQTPPPGCPVEGEDVVSETRMIPMRDGHEIEIKIYRKKGDDGTKALMMRAPEWRFPYAANDCFDALQWCQKNASTLNVDPAKTLLNGGSAGGGLSLVTALAARDAGLPLLAYVATFPVTVHPKYAPRDKYELKSFAENKNASVVNDVRLEWFTDMYMPEPCDDWRLSPLLAESLKGLPPAHIVVAGYDCLRDEGLAYAQRLKDEGNEVDLNVYAGLPHCFYMIGDHPKVRKYFDDMVAFVQKYTC
ncbi:uncharacterized protein J7T54_004749 [Emericellopsis cladophorae]|uniref:Alpha/beta hydrolase fold-3 domain-containing protein n=1 Tax=Emericellopsis cladophorae TaxID=2686198 RepID=A0A9P9Y6J4_9HYPO|nr:uncharacterized protein J7T54_004749 [Emericellopsis cladophorae]KAI6784203.1 hypothetical protein J7T54_004749 [Emericellopsis cladophorae]